uniref:Interferon regulatory factor 10 n=1 Tax=Sphaeramia orbicularis TaxID=375764 RepID=A0A673CFD9_9TELE
MEEGTKMHLKEWLIAQIESEQYEGLCWEDEDKTMFRIPWKHAAKKDYKQTEDAALFKAWAVYKGKFREGRDKADPTMWKTRLRCALNKSTDFHEVPERNQLDITEPYKVYRIQPVNGQCITAELKDLKLFLCTQKAYFSQILFINLSKSVLVSTSPLSFAEIIHPPHRCDFRMQVTLVYQGQIVTRVTTRSPDGCFILQGRVPLGNAQIYGPCDAEQLSFPSPGLMSFSSGMTEAMTRLLCHLERGVLLWVAPDGMFIKRFCQGRVYWSGPMAQHTDRPNKLEREKTFKLLDIPTFLNELQSYLQGTRPPPSYTIELCFGEEYPDPNIPKSKKLIMAQVVNSIHRIHTPITVIVQFF